MKFEDYNIIPEIKKNLEKAGFKRPTDIQYKSIPHILNSEDVLAVAQTGTGKTAAFAIPIINMLHKQKNMKRPDGVKCIVMVPTHELAKQITEVFQELGQNTRVKAYYVIGGVEQDPQIERLEKGVDVLVATPGRVFDLVNQGHLRLSRIKMLVLDEADHMLDLGFLKDINDLIRFLPRNRQTLFFSATIDDKIKKLAYSLVHNAIRIQVSPKNPVAKNVNHSVAFIEMDDKRFFLERVVNENPESKILVFVRTKVRAERVLKAMERVGIKSMTIHSDKEQDERFKILDTFKNGDVKMLIATDVSARGIDIPNVDYVVNYDLPDKSENYVHRVGRTGRGTQKGFAVSFCSSNEKDILAEIQEFLNSKIEVLKIDKNDYADTLDFTQDTDDNWKALIEDARGTKTKKTKAKTKAMTKKRRGKAKK